MRKRTRATALAKGHPLYFTGAPCSRGHIAPRYTRSKTCVECDKLGKSLRPRGRAAKDAMKRASARNRVPRWLSASMIAEIESRYADADYLTRETGELHRVDHIIPLNGTDCSGLHVPWNLQILTERDNVAKSNRYCQEDAVARPLQYLTDIPFPEHDQ